MLEQSARRIILLDSIPVSWKAGRLAVGIFAVETIILVDSVETLTILGNLILSFLKLCTRIVGSSFSQCRRTLPDVMLSCTKPH